MLNLLPWRQEQIRKIKRDFLLLLGLMTLLITVSSFAIRKEVLHQNLKILLQEKILAQEINKECVKKIELLKKNNSEQKVSGFLSEMQRQRKYLNILESVPNLLPPNGYLNFMALAKDELKMEGVLLSASDIPLKQFVSKLTKLHRLKLREQKIQLEQLSEQKFQLSFTL
jgi:Tfp pilus assembly protein PilN